jgi:heme exporter protein B
VNSPRLAFEDVACLRGGRLLFEGLSFALDEGGAALVTGPNGAGKSSLIRVAAGLLKPAAGIVTIEGERALLTEAAALDPELPVAKALGFWAELDGRRDAAEAALDAVGLAELAPVPVRLLSTGQRRRIGARGGERGAGVAARRAGQWAGSGCGRDAEPFDFRASVERRDRGSRDASADPYPRRAWRGDRGSGVSGFASLVWRELRRAWAAGGLTLPVAFFLLVAILFPFAIGPEGKLLARIGGGVIWAAALLAALLPVERLVNPDLESGVLDQLAVRGWTDASVAAAKTLGHWLGFAPTLLAATVITAGLLNLSLDQTHAALIALLIGTPGLAALGVATAALTAGLRGAGAVAGLVMLPFAVPLLIFGAGAMTGDASAMKLLGAVSLLLVAGCPFVAGAAMRMGRG